MRWIEEGERTTLIQQSDSLQKVSGLELAPQVLPRNAEQPLAADWCSRLVAVDGEEP
jgi:hypothetical protein